MATYLALPLLYAAAVAAFAADDVWDETVFAFGWREPARQNAGVNRIVWRPGNRTGGLGQLRPPRETGGLPERHLADLAEYFTCTLTGHDNLAPNDELAQYQVTRELFDIWWRVCRNHAVGNITLVEARWLIDGPNERRRGASIEAVGAILSPIPDAEVQTAPVDTAASITPKLVDTPGELMLIEPE
jgi:hypothetical protein